MPSRYALSRLILCTAALVALPGVALWGQQGAAEPPHVSANILTDAEVQAGWKLLFDGKTLDGWRAYKRENMAGWSVVDGAMTKERPTGDIVTTTEYGDFELAFDWKVAPGGNAGLFVRATEEYNKIYWSATEYQLLDDPAHPDGRNPLTSAGSAYGLYPSIPGTVKPAGEWNTSKIVAQGNRIEHWLNGVKMITYEVKSEDWLAKVKASKFAEYPNYGLATKGLIGIQGDHGGLLALRSIKIRPL